MFYSGLCYFAPTAIVLFAGIVIAISRWPRHPRVSATVLISLACMLVAAIGQQALYLCLSPPPGGSVAQVVIYFQVTAVVTSLIRAAGWAAMLAAIFSGRDAAPASRNQPLQFSIRGLLIVTFVVAVLCGLLRALAMLLGESGKFLLTLFDDIPVMLCWMVGGWLACSRWHLHPQVSKSTLIAIGLASFALVISLIFLLAFARHYALGWPMILFVISSLTLWPATWIVLLVAAFGWRTAHAVTTDSPFRESLE